MNGPKEIVIFGCESQDIEVGARNGAHFREFRHDLRETIRGDVVAGARRISDAYKTGFEWWPSIHGHSQFEIDAEKEPRVPPYRNLVLELIIYLTYLFSTG